MLDFFKKKCPICGMKDNGKFVEKFGKKFCSEEHAEEFEKNFKDKAGKLEDRGCCGN